MAFQTSASEVGARDKNSEDCERWGMPIIITSSEISPTFLSKRLKQYLLLLFS
jgi:hypothetical protein